MSFSLVPGFGQRFPKEDDGDYLWSYADCHAGSDRESLLIESCCTSLEEALAAEGRGAGRIELCVDLSVGGVTPPRELIREVVSKLTIPVNVLIRPNDGLSVREPENDFGFSAADFVYGEEAMAQMIADIGYCREVGAAGVVIGVLTPEGFIDGTATRRLVAAARPLSVTFHRAFDVAAQDPFEALDAIIACGCNRLLTSGRAKTAWEGRERIKSLINYVRSDAPAPSGAPFTILAGCGIRPEDVAPLTAATGASELHGTRIP